MKSFKKIIAVFLIALCALTSALVFASCSGKNAEFTVVMPDGAPALSMAKLMAEEEELSYDAQFCVVDSSTIQTYVTGKNPEADVCILPVNQAAQLLGDGDTYKMLGTVTHGNLFILSNVEQSENKVINTGNLSLLIGKSVGVVNLAAIPGLTFELILKEADIEYNIVGNDGKTSETAVNLYAIAADGIGVMNYDYYIAPEPAATTKVNAIEGLEFVGSLQDLYGEGGYPQAVIVAKSSVIESNYDFISYLIEKIEENSEWLLEQTTSMESVVSAVQSHLTEGLTPTFSAKNLNAQVIANCAINFVSAAECKEEVRAFLEKLSQVSGTEYTVSDDFFCDIAR